MKSAYRLHPARQSSIGEANRLRHLVSIAVLMGLSIFRDCCVCWSNTAHDCRGSEAGGLYWDLHL